MTTTQNYEIGGIHARMTETQAERWNSGDTTDSDLDAVRVFVPMPQNDYREISLRRATSARLEKRIAEMMDGMPANLTN